MHEPLCGESNSEMYSLTVLIDGQRADGADAAAGGCEAARRGGASAPVAGQRA